MILQINQIEDKKMQIISDMIDLSVVSASNIRDIQKNKTIFYEFD